jgi:hypothetical protein
MAVVKIIQIVAVFLIILLYLFGVGVSKFSKKKLGAISNFLTHKSDIEQVLF